MKWELYMRQPEPNNFCIKNHHLYREKTMIILSAAEEFVEVKNRKMDTFVSIDNVNWQMLAKLHVSALREHFIAFNLDHLGAFYIFWQSILFKSKLIRLTKSLNVAPIIISSFMYHWYVTSLGCAAALHRSRMALSTGIRPVSNAPSTIEITTVGAYFT